MDTNMQSLPHSTHPSAQHQSTSIQTNKVDDADILLNFEAEDNNNFNLNAVPSMYQQNSRVATDDQVHHMHTGNPLVQPVTACCRNTSVDGLSSVKETSFNHLRGSEVESTSEEGRESVVRTLLGSFSKNQDHISPIKRIANSTSQLHIDQLRETPNSVILEQDAVTSREREEIPFNHISRPPDTLDPQRINDASTNKSLTREMKPTGIKRNEYQHQLDSNVSVRPKESIPKPSCHFLDVRPV